MIAGTKHMIAILMITLTAGPIAWADATDLPDDLAPEAVDVYNRCVEEPIWFYRMELEDPPAYCACVATKFDQRRKEIIASGGTYSEDYALMQPKLECQPETTDSIFER
ncbi:MAG: hypothetical protein AAF563_17470 [Pseudomonadota bacterium]